MPFPTIDLASIRTYPIAQRQNLVQLSDLVDPQAPPLPFENPELIEVAAAIVAARQADRPVIVMMGAHVVKNGLSRLLIDLLDRGIITHLAGNGAVSIHDFELGLIGETSEDVASSIEDGSFGMAEETGALMNQAIRAGARDGLGIGEALGRFIAEEDRFTHRDVNLAYTCYRLGVPFTIHVTIGTDIIHQHPLADFGALGWASGQDFKIFCHSVSQLEGGVFLNFGSAVTGPEVFLKALSIARNLGHTIAHITTANFDLIPLGDYRRPLGYDDPHYYYRPRKNIVNRPTSLGGRGYHITGDHKVTLPNLYHLVLAELERAGYAPRRVSQRVDVETLDADGQIALLRSQSPLAADKLADLPARAPELEGVVRPLAQAFRAIAASQERGGTLFLCGNGGSFADALHITGELVKSYKRPRPLPEEWRQRLAVQPNGRLLAEHLEAGLRVITLGSNPSLVSAVDNDNPARHLAYAQELGALARPGDILLGISTSGNAVNVLHAATLARARGLTVVALTGNSGGRLASLANIAIRVPEQATDRVQEQHIRVYHTLCAMLEVHFYGNREWGMQNWEC